MAGEINDSNHSTSLGADLDIPNHEPMAYDSPFTGSWGPSYSSFLSAPFKPELYSNETDTEDTEDEFILELTRQIEDYTLQEDEDDNKDSKSPAKCFGFHNSIPKVKNQNQHRVTVNSKRGRRRKMTESTQQNKCYYSRGRASYRQLASSGSGMSAVFFNRPGSKTGYNGTGVFLPLPTNGPTARSRRIPGCFAVLVPTRVLEALEQHFNNLESLSSLNSLLQIERTQKGQRSGMQQKPRWRSASITYVGKKLPQE